MKTVKAGIMAIALLLAGGTVASAGDLCLEISVPSGAAQSLLGSSPALLVGRAFGALPTAGTCKDFRGVVPGGGPLAVWANGQSCGASDNYDVSFFMPMYNINYGRFGSLTFALLRATQSGVGIMCTAATQSPGGCVGVALEKITCPAGVTIPQGFEPCSGIC